MARSNFMSGTKKVLVLSDLHICDGKVREALARFKQNFDNLPGNLALDLHVSDEEALSAIAEHVRTIEPDLLLVAGDISSLGDRKSLMEGRRWLEGLLGPEGGLRAKCLVIPGNHDSLLGYLRKLQRLDLMSLLENQGREKWVMRLVRWCASRSKRKLIDNCLAPLMSLFDGIPEDAGLLDNFSNVFDGSGLIATNTVSVNLPHPGNSRIAVFPFRSSSSNFLWMNAGEARAKEWRKLRGSLEQEEFSAEGTLRIVLTHHNPISTPGKVEDSVTYAFNGMPGGTNFMRGLQQLGVDVILYGHQHEAAEYSFDFDLGQKGHCYGIGAPSATHRSNGGTVLLEVQDINNVLVSRYEYNRAQGRLEPPEKKIALPLERHRPDDGRTQSARYELKHYSNQKQSEPRIWEDLQGDGETLIYMSGRRFAEARESKFSALRRMIGSGARVRILSNDPELLIQLRDSVKEGTGRLGLWGGRTSLEKLVTDAREFFQDFGELVGRLSEKERERLDVRKAHTLLSVGAFVRDADQPWGKMTVKILPVGAFDELEPPIMRLNRRKDEALYMYYLKYLKVLIGVATSVNAELGLNWRFGEEDLEL